MFIEILQIIGGCVLLSIMAWFAYMGFHMNEETRKGRQLALPWEDYQEFKKWFTASGK
jgi:hypothetical protein